MSKIFIAENVKPIQCVKFRRNHDRKMQSEKVCKHFFKKCSRSYSVSYKSAALV